jgi:hypothetical protein
MLTMIDLHQDEELSHCEMGKVAGGSPLVDHLVEGVKSAGDNGKGDQGTPGAGGYLIGIAVGILLSMALWEKSFGSGAGPQCWSQTGRGRKAEANSQRNSGKR